MMARLAGLLAAGAMLWTAAAVAQARKPPVPAGLDPGGVAIAVLSTGIDYRLSEVAQRLARDGEGQLIAWDFVDNDNRPFNAAAADTPAAWGGDANELVRMVGRQGRRVVTIRLDVRDKASLARAVAFLARTPARIVVVPMSSPARDDWVAFGEAAGTYGDLLFIVAAGDDGPDAAKAPSWPAALGLPNMLVVTTAASAGGDAGKQASRPAAVVVGAGALADPVDSRTAAMAAADALAGCWPGLVQRYRGEALKQAFLAQAAKPRPGSEIPVIERCPDSPSPQR
jgi:hypothetical protein